MFDPDRFEKLYREYYARILVFCLTLLHGDRDGAEDAADETFVTLFRKWDSLDVGGKIGAWLYRTAGNKVKAVIKDRARTLGKVDLVGDGADFERSLGLSGSDVYFRSDVPEDEGIARILCALPEEYRELFRLRFSEKRTLSDISESTGLPYSTLRRRIARMTLAVRRIVRGMYEDSDIKSGD